MSKRLVIVLNLLGRYKYLVTIVIGVAIVGVIDDNSLLQHIENRIQISEMRDEIQKYQARNEAASSELEALKRNPRAIEKIARERYFMKADDEDIFVLSDDKPSDDGDNSTE